MVGAPPRLFLDLLMATERKKRKKRTILGIPPPAPRKTPRRTYVDVLLQLKHSVNGKSYGPGHVKIREDLADMFMYTEEKALEQERSLMQHRAFIIQAGPHGVFKREVSPARFDAILAQAEVLTTITP